MKQHLSLAITLGLVLAVSVPAQQSPANYTQIWFVPGNFGTIQDAIDYSSDSALILVAPGTYHGDIDFQGKDLTLRPSHNGDMWNTILEGTGKGPVVYFPIIEVTDSYGIFLFWKTSDQAILEGFTITGGKEGISPRREWTGNSYISATPSIHRCRFLQNSGRGLNIDSEFSNSRLEECIFEANGRSDSTSNRGGAIRVGFDGFNNPQEVFTIRHCIFKGNFADSGGAIYAYGDRVDLLKVEDCIFYGNQAKTGGVMRLESISATLSNCRIFANESRLSDLLVLDGQLDLIHSTLVGNAGAATLHISSGAQVRAVNSVFWNDGDFDFSTGSAGSTIQVDYCITRGMSSAGGGTTINLGINNLNQDPKLTNPKAWTLHLQADSPAVDAGDATLALLGGSGSLPATDMDGSPRIVGSKVDIGADEYDPQAALLYTDRGPISIANPGTLTFTLDAGLARASQVYVLVPSLSGIYPGTDFGTEHLPLNLDTLSAIKFWGNLDPLGQGSLFLDLSPLQGDLSLVGLEVFWAGAVLNGQNLLFTNNLNLEVVN